MERPEIVGFFYSILVSPSDAEQLFSFLSPRVEWIFSAADPQSSLSAVDISVADDVIGRSRRSGICGIQRGDSVALSVKSMLECDDYYPKEHRLDLLQHGFPVFALPSSLETLQKLNLDDGRDDSAPWLKGSQERRIGRWNYTIVPWED
jgi:hypothetical protein